MRSRRALACALTAAALPGAAPAQEATPLTYSAQYRPSWLIIPRISLTENWSDNINRLPEPFTESGWTTYVTPGVTLAHIGPKLRVYGDYSYQRSFHPGRQERDDSQNYLYATGSYEAVDRQVFIDARASISQENRSAFAAPVVPGSTDSGPNRAETRVFGISPHARGQIGEFALWQARVNATTLRTTDEFLARATRLDTTELIVGARSPTAGARLGWAVGATSLQSRADTTGTLEDNRVRADLIVGITPQLHLLLVEGYERTDFTRQGTVSDDTPGAGLEWSPGPRTQLAAVAQRRFFGTGHIATFTHRTAASALQLSSTRDSTVLTSVLGATAGTLQSLMSTLLLASIPDPDARTAESRRRLQELGSAPTTISTGFLTERPFIYDAQTASFGLIGTRNTIVLRAYRREQTALAGDLIPGDSFSLSEEILQRGYSAGWTMRLTPTTTVSLAASTLRTNGIAPSNLVSREDLATAFVRTSFGRNVSCSLGYRRIDFESNQEFGYRENVVFATLSFRL